MPSTVSEPLAGLIKPTSISINVLLPLPVGPTNPTNLYRYFIFAIPIHNVSITIIVGTI